LKTDISQFYPSIYTHAVDWVIWGKEEYKKNPKIFKNKPPSRLDKALMNSNSKHTKGIHIGPWVFSYVAKLFTARFNKEINKFRERSKLDFNFCHYVDDYYFFCNSHDDSEKILSEFIKIINNYELSINNDKTKIEKIENVKWLPWWQPRMEEALENIKIGSENKIQKAINIVFETKSKYTSEQALAYFLGGLVKHYRKNLGDEKPSTEIISFILGIVYREPSLLRMLSKLTPIPCFESLFRSEVFQKLNLKIMSECIQRNYTLELLWSLTFYQKYSIQSFNFNSITKNLFIENAPRLSSLSLAILRKLNEENRNSDLYQEIVKSLPAEEIINETKYWPLSTNYSSCFKFEDPFTRELNLSDQNNEDSENSSM
jgi:hypothetical protein